MDVKLNRLYASHVMIFPRLMKYLWRNHLVKEAVLLITIPAGLYFWKLDHHEPLKISCLLHIVKIRNWAALWVIVGINLCRVTQYIFEDLFHYKRRREKSTDMECNLRPMSEEVGKRVGNIMRKFLAAPGTYPPCWVAYHSSFYMPHPQ